MLEYETNQMNTKYLPGLELEKMRRIEALQKIKDEIAQNEKGVVKTRERLDQQRNQCKEMKYSLKKKEILVHELKNAVLCQVP